MTAPVRQRRPGVLLERHAEQIRHDVAGHVVRGRSKPPGDDHDVGRAHGVAQRTRKAGRLVPHHQLLDDVDTDRIEPIGNEQRVRVGLVGRQELRPDGDDHGGCRAAAALPPHPSITAGATATPTRTVT